MLRARHYGGVMTLIKKSLANVTTMIHCEDRFVVVKILNCLFINVYPVLVRQLTKICLFLA